MYIICHSNCLKYNDRKMQSSLRAENSTYSHSISVCLLCFSVTFLFFINTEIYVILKHSCPTRIACSGIAYLSTSKSPYSFFFGFAVDTWGSKYEFGGIECEDPNTEGRAVLKTDLKGPCSHVLWQIIRTSRAAAEVSSADGYKGHWYWGAFLSLQLAMGHSAANREDFLYLYIEKSMLFIT